MNKENLKYQIAQGFFTIKAVDAKDYKLLYYLGKAIAAYKIKINTTKNVCTIFLNVNRCLLLSELTDPDPEPEDAIVFIIGKIENEIFLFFCPYNLPQSIYN